MERRARIRHVAVVAILVSLLGTKSASAHETDAYSHEDSFGASHADWLSSIPGALRLSELSLPGTHDTLALHGGDAVECQETTVAEQLDAGIRVLDVRCRHIEDVFAIHHGAFFQEAFFGADVLEPCIAFLAAHSRETILMRVKEEYDAENTTRTFEETFVWYRDQYPGAMWTPTDDTNPRLDDVRGKIVILQNFSGGTYGLSWSDAEIQDDFNLTTNWDLHSKWEKVKTHLTDAEAGSRSTRYVNFLSGSGGSFPYFVASGHSSHETGASRLWTGVIVDEDATSPYPDFPRLDCALGLCSVYFEGTNVLTRNRINAGGLHRIGIIMADFPGTGLISAIIALNPWNYPPVASAGGPYVVDEGSPVLFDAGASSDHDGDPLTYQWDFDDDGTWDTLPSSGATGAFTWGDDRIGSARVLVSDGKSDTEATASVTVRNAAPTPTLAPVVQPNPDAILPFQELQFAGQFTDPGWLDTHTATWDFGDGATASPPVTEENAEPDATGSTAARHAFAEPGTYTVELRVQDDDGETFTVIQYVAVLSAGDALARVNTIIQGLPASAFARSDVRHKRHLADALARAIARIAKGQYLRAIFELRHRVFRRMDGTVGGRPQNDWIVDPAAQARLRRLIDDVIAWLNRKGRGGPFDVGTQRSTKLDVAEALRDLLPTGSARDDARITRAIPRIEASLAPWLWASDSSLSKDGGRVFDEERCAANELLRVLDPDVAPLLALLVDVDRSLAAGAIADAIAGSGKPKEIAKAQAHLAEGTQRAALGEADCAIESYGKAWEAARRAIR